VGAHARVIGQQDRQRGLAHPALAVRGEGGALAAAQAIRQLIDQLIAAHDLVEIAQRGHVDPQRRAFCGEQVELIAKVNAHVAGGIHMADIN
jgi:hypothetical protein